MTCTTCPNCGFDLERVERLQLDDLEIIRGSEVRWKGQRVKLTMSQTLLVSAIARADGAWVESGALADALGYEGDKAVPLINVHMWRIRHAFRSVDRDFAQFERTSRKAGGGSFTRWRSD